MGTSELQRRTNQGRWRLQERGGEVEGEVGEGRRWGLDHQSSDCVGKDYFVSALPEMVSSAVYLSKGTQRRLLPRWSLHATEVFTAGTKGCWLNFSLECAVREMPLLSVGCTAPSSVLP